MSHDLYASWVTTELTRLLKEDKDVMFEGVNIDTKNITLYANRESGRVWPLPDGRITMDVNNKNIEVALELKRTNEGLHGVLTAVGQALAYLKKGYDVSVIAVPEKYHSYDKPGQYIKELIDQTSAESNIIVVTYSEPDESKLSPFKNKLKPYRRISFDPAKQVSTKAREFDTKLASTQWAHVRAGSTEAHTFYKYLQTAKNLSSSEEISDDYLLHPDLLIACNKISSQKSIFGFLSDTAGSTLYDKIWRKFWFTYVLHLEIQNIWELDKQGNKIVSRSSNKLQYDKDKFSEFFSKTKVSIKCILVAALKSKKPVIEILKGVNKEDRRAIQKLDKSKKINLGTISAEDLAWVAFAINISNRAHSYRIDVQAGIKHSGFQEADGRPTELGYKFVDLCERTGEYFSGKPFMLLGAALLKEGQLAALLHYIHKISDDYFDNNPLVATKKVGKKGKLEFDINVYIEHLRDILTDELRVMSNKKGSAKPPLQDEFVILSKLGLIKSKNRYRIGCGLSINWPKFSEFMEIDIS